MQPFPEPIEGRSWRLTEHVKDLSEIPPVTTVIERWNEKIRSSSGLTLACRPMYVWTAYAARFRVAGLEESRSRYGRGVPLAWEGSGTTPEGKHHGSLRKACSGPASVTNPILYGANRHVPR